MVVGGGRGGACVDGIAWDVADGVVLGGGVCVGGVGGDADVAGDAVGGGWDGRAEAAVMGRRGRRGGIRGEAALKCGLPPIKTRTGICGRRAAFWGWDKVKGWLGWRVSLSSKVAVQTPASKVMEVC